MNARTTLAVLSIAALVSVGCSSDDAIESGAGVSEDPEPGADQPVTAEPDVAATPADQPPETPALNDPVASITLVAYDSFPQEDTSLNEALAGFTADTGIEVDLLIAGDAGTMLSKAALTAGNPEGDVMWGIDNTFLSRAVADGVFEPYAPATDLPTELTTLVPGNEVTPVDYGDVCVNYDIGYFAANGIEVPASLDDLADPVYRDLLVVENPATSSPGLAFVLASIDEFGIDGWQAYWSRLVDNGVLVVDGWTDAYYGSFTWAGGGDRPLVVSYGSSPPAEVIFADPARDDSPTGVIESTCFRQVEFAGVLAGTDAPTEARLLVDFLVSDAFQAELALNLFVYPANASVALPIEFLEFAVIPETSRSLDPAVIDEHRSTWIDEWTSVVLG